jgi:hypothetical protein
MAHAAHWLKYVLLGWPVISIVLTPFIARFLSVSSDQARASLPQDDEADLAMFGLVAPVHTDELTTFPPAKA